MIRGGTPAGWVDKQARATKVCPFCPLFTAVNKPYPKLQLALVATRSAYLGLYPEDEAEIGLTRWAVINGCRRPAAAANFGRPTLDIVVEDEVANDRVTLLAAAVIENVGRRDFDVIEEAKAVELLIAECGNVDMAAMKLAKSKGWISQRRSLLRLAPELQAALRNGELAVLTARTLAQVPPESQVQAWTAERERERQKAEPEPDPASENREPARIPVTAAKVTRTFRRLEADPVTLADALVDYLDADGLKTLIQALTDRHQFRTRRRGCSPRGDQPHHRKLLLCNSFPERRTLLGRSLYPPAESAIVSSTVPVCRAQRMDGLTLPTTPSRL